MKEKLEFLRKLGYTIGVRTYIDYNTASIRMEEWEEPYTVTIAFKEHPEEKYKDGVYMQKHMFKSLKLNWEDIYKEEYQKALDNIVHNSIK